MPTCTLLASTGSRIWVTLCTVLLFTLIGCGGGENYISGDASTPPPVTATTNAALQQSVNDYFYGTNQYYHNATGSQTPGAIVAVHLNGYQPWYYAVGCAEIDTAAPNTCYTPMTIDLPFRIASVTKMFIADVVVKLAAEGKLSLSDTVEKWLPGTLTGINAGKGSVITIGMLLNHTSGLYSYVTTDARLVHGDSPDMQMPMNQFVMSHGQKTWDSSEILGFVDTFDAPASFTTATGDSVGTPYGTNPTSSPGSTVKYSNTNYYLLGLIIEKATGNPVHDEVARLITAPLNLTQTYLPIPGERQFRGGAPFVHGYADYFNAPYDSSDTDLLKFRTNDTPDSTLLAQPYINGDGTLEDFSEVDPSFAWTTGGMVSNASDLMKFLQHVMVSRVQSRQESAYWVSGAPLDPNTTFQYARGLARIDNSLFGHSGQFAGYNVASYWLAPLDAYIVVMTNRYSYFESDPNNLGVTIATLPPDTLYKVGAIAARVQPSTQEIAVRSDLNSGLINTIIHMLTHGEEKATTLPSIKQ
ncbi:serine hydrolase domain-containing protein [Chrysiogenes arsenatis]|uniref:serine hydrolase domain-containing protein n=1 Tax=Chrysiogenes arsenatis TaxID=309797 RepID=UPI000402C475|nr:serine hydrolase domain-containing protein [Chrysiogenes arsenatis]